MMYLTVSTTVNEINYGLLKALAHRQGLTLSKLVRQALRAYAKAHENPPEEEHGET